MTLTPVLDAKPRNADQVIEVGRHERGLESKGMGRDGGVEILNARPTAFQGRLDAAEHLADGIGPLGSWEFGDEIETRLQRLRSGYRNTGCERSKAALEGGSR